MLKLNNLEEKALFRKMSTVTFVIIEISLEIVTPNIRFSILYRLIVPQPSIKVTLTLTNTMNTADSSIKLPYITYFTKDIVIITVLIITLLLFSFSQHHFMSSYLEIHMKSRKLKKDKMII